MILHLRFCHFHCSTNTWQELFTSIWIPFLSRVLIVFLATLHFVVRHLLENTFDARFFAPEACLFVVSSTRTMLLPLPGAPMTAFHRAVPLRQIIHPERGNFLVSIVRLQIPLQYRLPFHLIGKPRDQELPLPTQPL